MPKGNKMVRLTTKGMERHLVENYGEVRHNLDAMRLACVETAKQFNCKALDMFYFMIEQQPIPNLYTHSYGFNTGLGREIRQQFESNYNLN